MHFGNGFNEQNKLGPLINQKSVQKVEKLVSNAIEHGAQRLGTTEGEEGDLFYAPTILTDVNPSMDMFSEEIFGPVAPLYRFKEEDEAAQMANDTRYGLASYFYTRDISRAWRMAEKLEYGMVGVNETAISNAAAPFGGIKESGFGREGSKYGLEEYLDKKYVCFGID